MSVLLPLETTARELPYKLLLAMTLANRGIPAYVGRKSAIERLVRAESRYIYVDKGFHPGRSEDTWGHVRTRGGLIVSLDEEGAVDFPDGVTLRHRYSSGLFDAAAHVFLWGQRQKELVPEAHRTTSRISVTGHPRFQMLLPPYRALYDNAVAALRREFGEFLLVNTNMGFGNNLRGDAFVRVNYRDRFPRIDELIDLDKRKVSLYLEAIRALAQATIRTIVVRPHPEERLDTYEKALRDVPNVRVIYRGSAVPWIAASEALVHPDCTTAIEAVLLERPAISLVPADADAGLMTALPRAVSTCVTNTADLVTTVTAARTETTRRQEIEALVDAWFSIRQDSVALIADKLSELWVSTGNRSPRSLSGAARWSLLRGQLGRLLRPETNEPLLAQKLGGFVPQAVEVERRALVAVVPALASVRVRFLVDGLLKVLP